MHGLRAAHPSSAAEASERRSSCLRLPSPPPRWRPSLVCYFQLGSQGPASPEALPQGTLSRKGRLRESVSSSRKGNPSPLLPPLSQRAVEETCLNRTLFVLTLTEHPEPSPSCQTGASLESFVRIPDAAKAAAGGSCRSQGRAPGEIEEVGCPRNCARL